MQMNLLLIISELNVTAITDTLDKWTRVTRHVVNVKNRIIIIINNYVENFNAVLLPLLIINDNFDSTLSRRDPNLSPWSPDFGHVTSVLSRKNR